MYDWVVVYSDLIKMYVEVVVSLFEVLSRHFLKKMREITKHSGLPLPLRRFKTSISRSLTARTNLLGIYRNSKLCGWFPRVAVIFMFNSIIKVQLMSVRMYLTFTVI